MERLATIFDSQNALMRLEAFASEFGARFYKLPLTEWKIILQRTEPYDIPALPSPSGIAFNPMPWGREHKLGWRLAVTDL